jgi:hypothetical protein
MTSAECSAGSESEPQRRDNETFSQPWLWVGLTLAITWPQGVLKEEDSLGDAAQVNGGVRCHGFAIFHVLVSLQQSRTVLNKDLDVPRNAR